MRNTEYDPFAWLYAHFWGKDYHAQALEVLDRLVLRLLPSNARILDLCCGDGRIACQLHRRGFHVTGLDASAEMLRYARGRAPNVEFLLSDARDFDLPNRFNAIISTFDSLNHIPVTRDLGKVFKNAFNSLCAGGCFAFDLNREQAYIELWPDMSGIVNSTAVSVARSVYDPKRRTATCDITQFRNLDGSWERTDYRLTQKYHPEEKVLDALRAAGFSSIASFDASLDLDMRGSIGRYRTFYLARK